jgi:transposase
VRLVAEARPDHETEWAAMTSVAAKLGVGAETVRTWVRRSEVDAEQRPGVTGEESAELKRLRRENAELRRANEILKAASAFSPPSSTAQGRDDPLRGRAQGSFRVEPIIGVLRGADAGFLSVSGYYAAKTRPPSPRSLADTVLA